MQKRFSCGLVDRHTVEEPPELIHGIDMGIADGAIIVILGRCLLWMWILRILFTRSG